MQLEVSLYRAAVSLAFCFVWASCTFPSVEYETDTECVVPTVCQNDIDVCLKQADAQQMMCLSKCTTVCPSCGTSFEEALSMCLAQCEACSGNEGCTNATKSCKAMLGMP
ncbi:MAG TPA: hypothetical protein PK156_49950 [Polyangium sp.]|nr:hypothetical protein [Polyangium sp.]